MFLRGSEVTSGTLKSQPEPERVLPLTAKVGVSLKGAMTFLGCLTTVKIGRKPSLLIACSGPGIVLSGFVHMNAFTSHNKLLSQIVCLRSHKWQSLTSARFPALILQSFVALCISFAQ